MDSDSTIKVKEWPCAEGNKNTHVLELFILKAVEMLKLYFERCTYVNGNKIRKCSCNKTSYKLLASCIIY